MTIDNGYCTLAEYKSFANITSTQTTEDAAIETIIEGVSRYIDLKTQRRFYAKTATRYYDRPSGRELELDDDLLTITELLNGDDVEIASGDYNLIPVNDPPYRAIRLTETSTVLWTLDSDGNSEFVIDVAGTWGYMAAHTDDIREACLMTTQSFVKRRFGENVSGIAKVTAAGVVITPQDLPSAAADIINHYKKWT
jgi:hypothetical protein